MSDYSQSNRFLEISEFSFEEGTLLPSSFSGTEYVSDLFQFHISVLSKNYEISPEDVLGKSCTVTIKNEHKRKFNGFICSFEFGEITTRNLREYRLVMVPWLWFLGQTNNHRIFQNQNTKSIVSKIFKDWGFVDFDFKAKGGKTREYCVQHNESDLNFVSRLLEEEGIAYYFKHSDDKHQLVLVDEKNAYDEVTETKLQYNRGSATESAITKWDHSYKFKKGQWTLNDFDFKQPTKSLIANVASKSKFANNSKYEHYEYPAYYNPELADLGKELVNVRLDAEEALRNVVNGGSNCATFTAGGRFSVDRHTTNSEKGEYILVSVSHQAADSTYDMFSSGTSSYENSFVAIPSDVHFRPKERHPRKRMPGPQSAIVVCPDGEEIDVDQYGRIKVQFIWDREGKSNQDSSCYIRVMQTWAGTQWGASFIPRKGHEVIVSFLDGDPDRPIITGTVYNGKNLPPFESKTQSGIRTRSTKNGTAANCNELRFDDKKDAEQIYIHAEKNLDTEVENDETHTVDHDRTKTIGNDENSTIKHDRNKTVDNNQTETIGKNKTIDVGDNHTETIGKDMSLSVGKNISIDINDNHTETIGKNMTISVTKDLKETVEGKYTETVTKEYALKAKTITMTADDQITLKTGSASIVMKKNGDITISGKNINVKGSGNVVVKGSKITNN